MNSMNINLIQPRFGFILQSLELINHFHPIWSLLPASSVEIIAVDIPRQTVEDALKPWPYSIVSADEALQRGTRYPYLISNHPCSGSYAPPLVKQLGEHNIRFMYAAGKSGWNLSSWNQQYDAILCFGPFHAAAFKQICDAAIIQMGYPRFDRYFNTAPDPDRLRADFGCDPDKPTVVWLPTWKTLSSVGHFDDEIAALTPHYNVVVKVHPLMPESEPHRVEALKRLPLTRLITDHTDNMPLYQLADYMLFDYGGPPMAALYTDKNFLLLDVPGADADALTGNDSPDIALRQYLPHLPPGTPGLLHSALADTQIWKDHKVVRAALRNEFFAPYFGFSATVAAQALMHMDHILAHRPGAA